MVLNMTDLEFPLVSVVIRSMDRPTLQEALASVGEQAYQAIEVILVNACGRAHSPVPSRIGNATIRLVGGECALQRAPAANYGLQEARGEYILFLDDDDWLYAGHIERLVACLRAEPSIVLAYGAVECVRPGPDGAWERSYLFAQDYDATRLLVENYIPIHAALFRRSVVTKAAGVHFDESLEVYEDWDFWVQLSRLGSFRFVDEIGAAYRIAESSGFGTAGHPDSVRQGLLVFFAKWQGLWSVSEVVALAGYAKHHGMYWELRSLFDQRSEALQAMGSQCEALAANLERLTLANEVLREDCSRLNDALQEIYQSHSWRLTMPLRRGMELFRSFRHQGRAWYYFARQNFGLALQVGRAEGVGAVWRRGKEKLARMRARRKPAISKARVVVETGVYPLVLPVVKEGSVPEVSIIIPVHNKYLYTFTCLKSLTQGLDGLACEVVVVDDHSSDDTAAMLAQVAGVRVVPNRGERGFVPSCNLGAGQARGRYIVFLNNDTWVEPGWLLALKDVFGRRPDAGVVGGKLLYPDGLLQEAGAILWRDASAWNYGKGQDETRPEFNYLRVADYCSGACIMLPRALFESVGGFSTEFAPAYYEDADLALKLRAAGHRAYYQPHARVYHFEGVSAGQNTLSSGLKSYQLMNRERLLDKWSSVLLRHQVNGVKVWQERDRDATRRILVVDKIMLTPDQDSGSLRMFRLLQELVGLGVKVVFATLYLDDSEPGRRLLQGEGIEVLGRPHVSTVQTYLCEYGEGLDAVILSRLDVAEQLLEVVRSAAPQAKILFDTVDLHFLREERMAEHLQDMEMARAARKRREIELGLMHRSDVTLVVSHYEQALLVRESPDLPVEVVSNIHELHPCKAGFEERMGVLFIGGFNHPPNVDAVCFFVKEVLPLLRNGLGDIPVWIIGSHPPEEVRALASAYVHVTGYVEDVSGYFAQVRLSVAPLRYGAGVKGKVNQSMAYGVPVVATTMAVEGMALTDGEDVLVADSAADFAAALTRVYQDAGLWQRLSAAGQKNIESHFSRALARETMRKLLFSPD